MKRIPPCKPYRARITYYSPAGHKRSVSYRVDAEMPELAKRVARFRLSRDKRRVVDVILSIDLIALDLPSINDSR